MKKLFAWFLCCMVAVLATCTPLLNRKHNPQVYVAGAFKKESSFQACYWINGRRVELPGANSKAFGIVQANGHLYVVGFYNDNKACIWVDGTRQDLTNGAIATGIVVVEDTVIVSGTTNDSDSKACVWINGTQFKVTESFSSAVSVTILNGTTICIAGSFMDSAYYKAAVWSRPLSGGNWTKTVLHTSNYDSSEALSITSAAGQLLIGGRQYKDGDYFPFVWKGNTPGALAAQALSTLNAASNSEPQVFGTALYNNHIYATGFYKVQIGIDTYWRAALWKGTNDPALYAPEDDNDTAAFGVFVYGDAEDVYVAGNIEKTNGSDTYIQPVYWENGVRIELDATPWQGGNGEDYYASGGAFAIVVY